MEIYLQSAWQMYFCGQKKSILIMLRGMIRSGHVFLSTARVKGWNQSYV